MRVSKFPLLTVKETPTDAEITSHKLMIRSGMIRKLAAGLYTWTHLGLRVLRKVENIVRDEMNNAGALELQMPTVQPTELWDESGRLAQYGPELLRFRDRHDREFCYGPTHEEIITDFARKELKSHKQLPINLYQIHTKFRDEIRPRFGVMRAREFLMKDAYSFHTNYDCLEEEYQNMFTAYSNMFTKMGLEFRPVLADTGNIGGSKSHEFHVLASSGEDAIAFSDGSNYAANVELAEAVMPNEPRPVPSEELQTIDTPDQETIEEVSSFLNVPKERCIKTLIVAGSESPVIALLLRGDDELNEIKADKLPEVETPLRFATDEEIKSAVGCNKGSLGPVGIEIPVIADRNTTNIADWTCGANIEGKHLRGVNWERDLPLPQIADLRKVKDGDPSPDGQGKLSIARGVEVGHIFQLGTKYSEAFKAAVQNEAGESQTMIMGTYGIGVSRIVAAAIEQNNDDRGIIWPDSIAPFQVAIVPMNMHKSERVQAKAEELYKELRKNSIDVLFDDRKARPGFMFADMELIGIPHRIVIGDKGLDRGVIEYRKRDQGENQDIAVEEIIQFLKDTIQRQ